MSSSKLLFATVGRSVHALDQATGSIIWEVSVNSGRVQISAHADRVYVVSEDNKLLVLKAQDGALLAQTPLTGRGQTPTILIDEEQVFVTSGGVLQSFDLDGKLLWTNEFKGKGNGLMSMATKNKDRQGDEF